MVLRVGGGEVEGPLRPEVKGRFLGHWGHCPREGLKALWPVSCSGQPDPDSSPAMCSLLPYTPFFPVFRSSPDPSIVSLMFQNYELNKPLKG